MKYYDDEPTLFYKLEEVKDALKSIEKVSFNTNEFLIDEKEEVDISLSVFKNKIGSIKMTIKRGKKPDAPLLF